MNERKNRGDRSPQRRPAEGVRIIRADEAQAALDAGEAAGRRSGRRTALRGRSPGAERAPLTPSFPLPVRWIPPAAVPLPPAGVAPGGGAGPAPADVEVADPAQTATWGGLAGRGCHFGGQRSQQRGVGDRRPHRRSSWCRRPPGGSATSGAGPEPMRPAGAGRCTRSEPSRAGTTGHRLRRDPAAAVSSRLATGCRHAAISPSTRSRCPWLPPRKGSP